ncbi:MAG: glycosyltransferase [Alistipes sp.]
MISICVTTYNGEKYIRQQLDSILTQLQPDDEIIVSDDGSTDDTLAQIAALNDSRIKIYKHSSELIPYNGVFGTLYRINRNMNNALKYAKGDYIFLADQDDVWLPNKVSRTIQELQNADCVVHNCVVVDKNLNVLSESFFDYIRPSEALVGNLIRSSFMGCCMAFTRRLYLTVYPIPELPIEHDTWIGLCALKKHTLRVVDDKLILYRRHGFNVSCCGEGSKNSFWVKVKRRFYMIRAYCKVQTL